VGNMCDLFHKDVPFEYIAGVFGHMNKSKHTFLILTKRAGRMKAFIEWFKDYWLGGDHAFGDAWPYEYPTVWLGVTAENQARAGERIPLLLETPAAHRWLSTEPLLGPINLSEIPIGKDHEAVYPLNGKILVNGLCGGAYLNPYTKLDLVITGGESGRNARPMAYNWVKGLKDQCDAANVKFHFKQWSAAQAFDEASTFEGIDYSKINPFKEDLRGRMNPC